MRGGLSLPLPSHAIGIFLRTAIVDEVLPLLAFCMHVLPNVGVLVGVLLPAGSSGRSTNNRNNDD